MSTLTSTLSPQQVDLAANRLERIRPPAGAAARLVRLAAEQPPAGADELGRLAGYDPATACALLSAAGAIRRTPVGSLADAVAILGEQQVRTLLLHTHAEMGPCPVDKLALWTHSLAVAHACRSIVEQSRLDLSPEQAYLAGLLHDVGRIALVELMPKSYQRVCQMHEDRGGVALQTEQEILGVDHTLLGRRLGRLWRLPDWLIETIWLHHHPPQALPAGLAKPRLVAVVGVASELARQKHLGLWGLAEGTGALDADARAAGLEPQRLLEIGRSMPETLQPVLAEMGLTGAGGPQAYVAALHQANAALARVDGAEGRENSVRRVWDTVRAFQAELDSAGLEELLTLIARHWGALVGGEPVMVYALQPDAPELLVLRVGPEGPGQWRTVARAPSGGDSAPPDPDEGPYQLVQRLLTRPADLNDWLGERTWCHLPLRGAGAEAGGVFLPAGRWERGELAPLTEATGTALSLVLSRLRAERLAEQLVGSSRQVADWHEAVARDRTITTVGTLAAGAAHEINNPLAVVSGRAQLMRERAGSEQERRTWAIIAEQAHRVSDIVTELMEFADPPIPHPTAIDVPGLYADVIHEFCSQEHPNAAAVRFDIRDEGYMPPVWADRTQLIEVLVELLANAATAAGNQPLHVELSARADGYRQLGVLKVTDDGPGMDETTLAQACMPFFSSQPAGRRRGLGLPRAQRFVERNGGRLWVRSRPGRGTTVHIQLPIAEDGRPDEDSHEQAQ